MAVQFSMDFSGCQTQVKRKPISPYVANVRQFATMGVPMAVAVAFRSEPIRPSAVDLGIGLSPILTKNPRFLPVFVHIFPQCRAMCSDGMRFFVLCAIELRKRAIRHWERRLRPETGIGFADHGRHPYDPRSSTG